MSKIEWTNRTYNPIVGCTKVSAGCDNCYAEKMARRLATMKNTSYYGNVVGWDKTNFSKTHGEIMPVPTKWNNKTCFVESALNKRLPSN